ncbi:MAG: CvpA family protein [Pseudomonadales bacterium]|nr:CvpA family protein [Pseudomonadales bacterium]
MNGVDTAILIVTTLSCAFGLWRGLVKEVLSLLTWIAALLVARVYSAALSEILVNVIENSSVRYVAAFAMIFVVVMMLGTLLNHLFSKLLTITGLKLADRLLGGVFGVARGVIIVLVILFISGVFLSETEQWQQSTLIPYGLAMIEWSRIFIEDFNSVNLTQ